VTSQSRVPEAKSKRLCDATHLSDLHMLRFLRRHEQNKGLSGGQYYEYELDLGPDIVLATRAEIAEHTE